MGGRGHGDGRIQEIREVRIQNQSEQTDDSSTVTVDDNSQQDPPTTTGSRGDMSGSRFGRNAHGNPGGGRG